MISTKKKILALSIALAISISAYVSPSDEAIAAVNGDTDMRNDGNFNLDGGQKGLIRDKGFMMNYNVYF
ncbi:hypothetical protein FHW31_003672 [Enterobacter asburiae]|uniref:hypothetical protein n=1 Tax=Enterobacter asburiae TaxID=61645 RepID=UPI00141A7B28|nr:hypothetical protein [Enterobacter asburiae]NIH92197.1 hypothetical protein [Enterobacter asburiae]